SGKPTRGRGWAWITSLAATAAADLLGARRRTRLGARRRRTRRGHRYLHCRLVRHHHAVALLHRLLHIHRLADLAGAFLRHANVVHHVHFLLGPHRPANHAGAFLLDRHALVHRDFAIHVNRHALHDIDFDFAANQLPLHHGLHDDRWRGAGVAARVGARSIALLLLVAAQTGEQALPSAAAAIVRARVAGHLHRHAHRLAHGPLLLCPHVVRLGHLHRLLGRHDGVHHVLVVFIRLDVLAHFHLLLCVHRL